MKSINDLVRQHMEYSEGGLLTHLYEIHDSASLEGGNCKITRYAYNEDELVTDSVTWYADAWRASWNLAKE